jgi:hypothetical protein
MIAPLLTGDNRQDGCEMEPPDIVVVTLVCNFFAGGYSTVKFGDNMTHPTTNYHLSKAINKLFIAS